jgi:hypothetical protein
MHSDRHLAVLGHKAAQPATDRHLSYTARDDGPDRASACTAYRTLGTCREYLMRETQPVRTAAHLRPQWQCGNPARGFPHRAAGVRDISAGIRIRATCAAGIMVRA